MRKLLFFGLCLLFLVPNVLASVCIPIDTVVSAYTFDDDLTDQKSSNDFTNLGSANDTGFIDDGRRFDGANDGLEVTNFINATQSWTLNGWANFDTSVSQEPVIGFEDDGAGEYVWYNLNFNNFIKVATNGDTPGNGVTNINDSSWFMWTLVYNGSEFFEYVNGTLDYSVVPSDTSYYNDFDKLVVGRAWEFAADEEFDGLIDEITVWNTSLNASVVSALFNSSDYEQYPFVNNNASYCVGGGGPGNNAPTISIHEPTAAQEFQTVPYQINFTVSDLEDSPLEVNASVNGTNVYVNGSYTANFTAWFDDTQAAGYYELTISAWDGEDLSTDTVNYHVNISANDPPTANITSFVDGYRFRVGTYDINFTASDADNATFQLDVYVNGSSVYSNSSFSSGGVGSVSDTRGQGTYNVTVIVDDGNSTVNHEKIITVDYNYFAWEMVSDIHNSRTGRSSPGNWIIPDYMNDTIVEHFTNDVNVGFWWPEFVVQMGDAVDAEAGSCSVWKDWGDDYLASFDPNVKGIAPHTIMGNHESEVIEGDRGYTCTEQEVLDRMGESSSNFTWYDGMFQFVTFNSAYDRQPGDSDAQFDILASDITWFSTILNESRKPIVLFSHVPLDNHSSAIDTYQRVRSRQAIYDLINESDNVVAVFQAHDHKGPQIPTEFNRTWTCYSEESEDFCPHTTNNANSTPFIGVTFLCSELPDTCTDNNKWFNWYKMNNYLSNKTLYVDPVDVYDETNNLDGILITEGALVLDWTDYTRFEKTILAYNTSNSIKNTIYPGQSMVYTRSVVPSDLLAYEMSVSPDTSMVNVTVYEWDVSNTNGTIINFIAESLAGNNVTFTLPLSDNESYLYVDDVLQENLTAVDGTITFSISSWSSRNVSLESDPLEAGGGGGSAPSNGLHYWDFDGDADDSWASLDGTVDGAAQSGSYPSFNLTGTGSTNSYSFDGTDDLINFTDPLAEDEYTWSLWFNADTIPSSPNKGPLFGSDSGGIMNNDVLLFLIQGTVRAEYQPVGGPAELLIVPFTDTTNWHHLALTVASGNTSLYLDGALVNTTTTQFDISSNTKHTYAGWQINSTEYYDGLLDEIKVYNESLSSSEVQNLYNCNEETGCATNPFIQINVKDLYDDEDLSGLTVNLSTGPSNTTDGSGIAYFYNQSYVAGLEFGVSDATGEYFNVTGVSTNSSWENTTTITYIHGANVLFEAYNVFNGTITGFTVTSGSQTNTTAGTSLRLVLKPGTSNSLLTESSGYVNLTSNQITTDADANSYNITGIYQTAYNFTAKNGVTETPITAFEVITQNLTVSYINQSSSNAEGWLAFYLMQGYNYTFNFSTVGFSDQSLTAPTNASYHTYQWIAVPSSSLNLTIKYESNLTIASGLNVSVDLIGDVYSNETDVLTGNQLYEGVPSGEYIIRYTASGYTQRFAVVEVNDTSFAQRTVYLGNESALDSISIIVIDERAQPVEGAIVKAKKYYPSLGSFIIVDEEKTDSDGSVLLDLVKFDEIYQFVVVYEEETVLTTEESTVKKDEITLQINTGDEILAPYIRWRSIDYTFTFSNKEFEADYNNIAGLASKMCVEAYRVRVSGKTLYNSTCSVTSADTIATRVVNDSGAVYEGKLYAYDSSTGQKQLLKVLTVEYPGGYNLGVNGLFWQLILSLFALGAALYRPQTVLISLPLSLVVGKLIELHQLSWNSVWGIMIVGVIIYIGVRQR